MSNINLSRTQRRAIERKARRMNKAKVVGGGTLVALLAGGIVSPAMAADKPMSGKAEVVLNDWYGNWEIKDESSNPLKMTDAERENIIRLASGKMKGSVKLSMSDADKKKLTDAGVNFDIEASEKMTNKRIAEIGSLDYQNFTGVEQPQLMLKHSVDDTKARAVAKSMGITAQDKADNPFTFGSIHSSQRMIIGNIQSDKVWGDMSKFNKGDETPAVGTVNESLQSYDSNGEAINGYTGGAYLYPVSQVVAGGIADEGSESSNASTTLVDPYADGDSSKRQEDIKVNTRGFTGDLSNCLTDDCGVWFALEVRSEESGSYLLTDPVKLQVESSVSAGKTPSTMTLKSGDKVSFVSEKAGVLGYDRSELNKEHFNDYYFTAAKVGVWQFESQFQKALAYLTREREVDIHDAFEKNETGVMLTVSTSHDGVVTSKEKVSDSIVRLTVEAQDKTTFKVDGKQFTASDIGKRVSITADHTVTLESITDNKAVFLVENTQADMSVKDVVSDLNLEIKQTIFLPAASLHSTGGYSLTYTKAPEKPVETPIQTPTPKPTPKPEPTPEPELPKPEAIKDVKTGKQGEPVTVSVMDNDSVSKGFKYKAKSLRLVSPESKKQVMNFAFEGKGEYKVIGENVVFTPEAEFAGKAPAIGYSWVESNGEVEQGASSTVQVTITEANAPVVTPEPTPTPEKEKEKETPKPKPTDDPIKPVSDPEPKPTDDPIVPDNDKDKPKPTGDPIEEDKVIEDKPTDTDGGKSDPEKVEEGINNSGADTATVAIAGGGLLAALAGLFMFRGRKAKVIKPAKKH